jgi:hypothetical protein
MTGPPHEQLPRLADVAHAERAHERDVRRRQALRAEIRARLGLELAEDPLHLGVVATTRPHEARAHVVAAQVGDEGAEGREVPRRQRHDHPRHLQLVGEQRRMHRAGAAVGDQREVARVVAARDRDLLDRAHHARHRDPDNTVRDRVDVGQPGQVRAQAPERFERPPRVEVDLARKRHVGAGAAEDDVRVGDRRLDAPSPVARGAGIGAGAARPDAQRPAGVEPCDATAAGADRVDLDLRRPVRQAADVLLGRERRLEVLDETDVGARAAHVVRDQVALAREPPEVDRGGDASGRAREHRVHRIARGDLGRHDAAARRGDEHLATVVALRERPRERRQITAHLRPDVRVERRGAAALVLAELRQHVRGRRDEPARQHLGGDARRGLLVRGPRIAVEEADDERGGIVARVRAHACERSAHLVLAQRAEHRAVERHALVDLDDPRPRDERRRLLRAHVVEDRPVRAADLEGVAEAARGEHPHRRALSLEHGVGADGGAVNDAARGGEIDLELGEGVEQPDRGIRGHGRRLADLERAGCLVVDDDVREGAAHVDADPLHQAPRRAGRPKKRAAFSPRILRLASSSMSFRSAMIFTVSGVRASQWG